MESNNFKCTYCNKSFQRERTLQVHLCEPKRRHLQKSEKWVQTGFIVFCRFYEIHQKNGKTKKNAVTGLRVSKVSYIKGLKLENTMQIKSDNLEVYAKR